MFQIFSGIRPKKMELNFMKYRINSLLNFIKTKLFIIATMLVVLAFTTYKILQEDDFNHYTDEIFSKEWERSIKTPARGNYEVELDGCVLVIVHNISNICYVQDQAKLFKTTVNLSELDIIKYFDLQHAYLITIWFDDEFNNKNPNNNFLVDKFGSTTDFVETNSTKNNITQIYSNIKVHVCPNEVQNEPIIKAISYSMNSDLDLSSIEYLNSKISQCN
ncbi:MAG: hypothetical protein JKY10_11485 [Cohaesibacteraceae bacterium]|nr:hypothetical protein [Cohaesibacteraceae bacterium]